MTNFGIVLFLLGATSPCLIRCQDGEENSRWSHHHRRNQARNYDEQQQQQQQQWSPQQLDRFQLENDRRLEWLLAHRNLNWNDQRAWTPEQRRDFREQQANWNEFDRANPNWFQTSRKYSGWSQLYSAAATNSAVVRRVGETNFGAINGADNSGGTISPIDGNNGGSNGFNNGGGDSNGGSGGAAPGSGFTDFFSLFQQLLSPGNAPGGLSGQQPVNFFQLLLSLLG